MIGKQSSTLLRRSSKSSLQSLSPSPSPTSSAGDLSSSRMGCSLKRSSSLRRSSSSLYLQGLAMADNLSVSSFGSRSSLIPGFEDSEPNAPLRVTLEETGGKELVQYLLLLAMALQIPGYFAAEDLSEQLPLLLVLGVVPSMLWLRSNKPTEKETTESLSSLSFAPLASKTSLAEIEEYYRQQELQEVAERQQVRLATSSSQSAVDEWGHFTELDDALQEQDVDFLLERSSSRLSNLGTLLEEAEEED